MCVKSGENGQATEEKTENDRLCWLRTGVIGLGAMVVYIFVGINEAQSSVLLPQLRKNDSSISLTANEETWIASLGFLMAPVFAVICGPFIDMYGRKRGLQYIYFITCLGHAVISSAQGFSQICLGRIICGQVTGQFIIAAVYLAEICTVSQREYSLAVLSGLVSFGVVLSNSIGGYLPWRFASVIYSVISFVCLLAVCFIPESPAWLFKMDRENDCIRSFQKLGRSEANIHQEINILKLQHRKNEEHINCGMVLEPTIWKPFLIMVVFYFLQCGSGIFDILYYSVDFIESLHTTYDPLKLSIILAITRLLACSTIVIFFRSKVSRRFSLAFSCFWMTVAFVGIGIYEYVLKNSYSIRLFQWIPVVLLLIYIISSVIGMFGLVSVMTGEVYPLKARGIMGSVTMAVGNCFMLLFVKNYRFLIDLLQVNGLVFMYAGFSFIGIFFALYVLPETQNKSLYEIEQGFLPKKKRTLEITYF